MIVKIQVNGFEWSADLRKPLSIGITLRNGKDNPNCFYAEMPSIKPFRSGNFIGDIKKGAPVNFKNVSFNPHGNGTHTECSGHILDNGQVVGDLLEHFFFPCRLITLTPTDIGDDKVLGVGTNLDEYNFKGVEALVIRSLPNSDRKLIKDYSGCNPPYFDPLFMSKVNELDISHFLTDLPSVDKEKDGGKLSSHCSFWNSSFKDRTRCTITELIYVPDGIVDGLYLLELQIMNLDLDASPSRPLLYKLYE